jgi:DNA helicase-2/ATP-dependent DNA helicase PcrA
MDSPAYLFPMAKLTILGDISQKTSDMGMSIDRIEDYFTRKTVFYRLTRSYRSTSAINRYLKTIEPFAADDADYFDRKGEEVSFMSFTKESVISALDDLEKAGYKSNAIICADRSQCAQVREMLEDVKKVTLIGEDDIIHPRTNVVIPSYLTKGLEFDGVIVIDKDGEFSLHEKGLYYVACSRALHKLYVAR